jgi:hypothetical protein
LGVWDRAPVAQKATERRGRAFEYMAETTEMERKQYFVERKSSTYIDILTVIKHVDLVA